jgi:hypothetical protein
MTNYFIRVAQELDYEHISKHLLVVGELTGDCFSCRHIGIDYSREKYCPGCKTAGGSQVARLCQRRPDLTYVEYADIKEIADKQKAKGLFK